MNIDVIAFEYVNLRKGNKSSLHCTYLRCSPKSSKVSFDGDSNTGGIHQKCAFPKRKTTSKSPSYRSHWYALRTTYGREKRAYNFIVANGKTVFYLTVASYLCQRNWRKRKCVDRASPTSSSLIVRRRKQVLCLRQRKPPYSFVLLSLFPFRQSS